MHNTTRKSKFFIVVLLLISVVSIPFVLTWRDVRQHQINHILVNDIEKGDSQHALIALNHGADGRAEVPEEQAPPLPVATVLRARLTGKSVPTVHGTPTILVALGFEAAQWRPHDVKPDVNVGPPPENPKLIGALLAHGADANVIGRDREGGFTTPLLLALRWRYERVARLLVSKGAQVNLADSNGGTPLMEAVAGEHPVSLGTVDFLIAQGARINDQDHDGNTALIEAISQAKLTDTRIIDYLVQHHADINVKNHDQGTCLIYAVDNFNITAVQALIGYHADVNAEDANGTVLHHAYHNIDEFVDKKKLAAAHNTIIALLKQAGAKE